MRNMDMKRRKELQEEYKQLKTYMGVTQITNIKNGKIYISSFPNLKNRWLTLQGQLVMGMHVNAELQKDWNELGPESFSYEVLEKKDANGHIDKKWELKQMEKQWLEKLLPYGDKGYNKPPKN
jgi:hypothetical protein